MDIKTLIFLEGEYCIHLMVYLVVQQETKIPPAIKITNKFFTQSFNFLHRIKPPRKWLKNYIKKMYKKSLLIPYVIRGLADFHFILDFIEPFLCGLTRCYHCTG